MAVTLSISDGQNTVSATPSTQKLLELKAMMDEFYPLGENETEIERLMRVIRHVMAHRLNQYRDLVSQRDVTHVVDPFSP